MLNTWTFQNVEMLLMLYMFQMIYFKNEVFKRSNIYER